MTVFYILWVLLVINTRCALAADAEIGNESEATKNIQPAIFDATTPYSNIEIETSHTFDSDDTTDTTAGEYTVSIKDILDGKVGTELPQEELKGINVIQQWLKHENETGRTTTEPNDDFTYEKYQQQIEDEDSNYENEEVSYEKFKSELDKITTTQIPMGVIQDIVDTVYDEVMHKNGLDRPTTENSSLEDEFLESNRADNVLSQEYSVDEENTAEELQNILREIEEQTESTRNDLPKIYPRTATGNEIKKDSNLDESDTMEATGTSIEEVTAQNNNSVEDDNASTTTDDVFTSMQVDKDDENETTTIKYKKKSKKPCCKKSTPPTIESRKGDTFDSTITSEEIHMQTVVPEGDQKSAAFFEDVTSKHILKIPRKTTHVNEEKVAATSKAKDVTSKHVHKIPKKITHANTEKITTTSRVEIETTTEIMDEEPTTRATEQELLAVRKIDKIEPEVVIKPTTIKYDDIERTTSVESTTETDIDSNNTGDESYDDNSASIFEATTMGIQTSTNQEDIGTTTKQLQEGSSSTIDSESDLETTMKVLKKEQLKSLNHKEDQLSSGVKDILAATDILPTENEEETIKRIQSMLSSSSYDYDDSEVSKTDRQSVEASKETAPIDEINVTTANNVPTKWDKEIVATEKQSKQAIDSITPDINDDDNEESIFDSTTPLREDEITSNSDEVLDMSREITEGQSRDAINSMTTNTDEIRTENATTQYSDHYTTDLIIATTDGEIEATEQQSKHAVASVTTDNYVSTKENYLTTTISEEDIAVNKATANDNAEHANKESEVIESNTPEERLLVVKPIRKSKSDEAYENTTPNKDLVENKGTNVAEIERSLFNLNETNESTTTNSEEDLTTNKDTENKNDNVENATEESEVIQSSTPKESSIRKSKSDEAYKSTTPNEGINIAEIERNLLDLNETTTIIPIVSTTVDDSTQRILVVRPLLKKMTPDFSTTTDDYNKYTNPYMPYIDESADSGEDTTEDIASTIVYVSNGQITNFNQENSGASIESFGTTSTDEISNASITHNVNSSTGNPIEENDSNDEETDEDSMHIGNRNDQDSTEENDYMESEDFDDFGRDEESEGSRLEEEIEDEITQLENEFDEDLDEIDHILKGGDDHIVVGSIRSENEEECLRMNLSMRISYNNTEFMVPNNALILGNCSETKQHVKITWRTDMGRNDSVYFIISNEDLFAKIEYAQIKLNQHDVGFGVVVSEKYFYDSVSQEEALFEDILFPNGVSLQFLNSQLTLSKSDKRDHLNLSSASPLVIQIASGSFCLFVVIIGVFIFTYRRLRSKTRIFKVNLDK